MGKTIDEKLLENITKRLANITDDENDSDEKKLQRISDEKTIELFGYYQKLANLMLFHKGEWNSTDYSDHSKYVNAIMDFDCGNDDFCKANKINLMSQSTLLYRKPQTTTTKFDLTKMDFNPPKRPPVPEGGRGRKVSNKSRKSKSRKSRKTKYRKTKSRKTKSRRH